jgi:hypothetical protein
MGATFSDRPSVTDPRYVFSPAVTWAVAAINAWNRVAISFRSVPGMYQPKNAGA